MEGDGYSERFDFFSEEDVTQRPIFGEDFIEFFNRTTGKQETNSTFKLVQVDAPLEKLNIGDLLKELEKVKSLEERVKSLEERAQKAEERVKSLEEELEISKNILRQCLCSLRS